MSAPPDKPSTNSLLVKAAPRNLAIGFLRLAGFTTIAAATRRLAALPW
ncbi:MAG TPA: hypothetical protein VIJ28_09330 [Chloroflexota bacterium]